MKVLVKVGLSVNIRVSSANPTILSSIIFYGGAKGKDGIDGKDAQLSNLIQYFENHAAITVNCALGYTAVVTLGGAACQIENPTNFNAGDILKLVVKQDTEAQGYISAWGSMFAFSDDAEPFQSMRPNAVDVFYFEAITTEVLQLAKAIYGCVNWKLTT